LQDAKCPDPLLAPENTRSAGEEISVAWDLENEHMPKSRPLWQRIVLPFIGLILIIIGLLGWLMPIVPGFPLIIIGVIFLFAFSSRLENKVREKLRNGWQKVKVKLRRG